MNATRSKMRGSLTIFFYTEVTYEAKLASKRGRQPDYSEHAL